MIDSNAPRGSPASIIVATEPLAAQFATNPLLTTTDIASPLPETFFVLSSNDVAQTAT